MKYGAAAARSPIILSTRRYWIGNDRLPLIREGIATAKKRSAACAEAVVCRELGPPECVSLETFGLRRSRRAGARRHQCRGTTFQTF